MKKLGLDLGDRSLGIAVSDDLNWLARPIETLKFEDKDFDNALKYTLSLVNEHKIDTIVLGLPKNMDGTEGIQAKTCRTFKDSILENINIKVILWDERLTSKMASNMMIDQKLKRKKRKQSIDAMAAVIILQGYLDSLK
ncbi:Putative Holliday junction resolvase [Candidatus Izimaplasma bacterium HR1]|uniref:Holliday junction resolvase RuvX n=1 Tax=Candidatus Izimoplasma sp. HR1 TaxID=1541959 RepID=UPI0004F689DE|nr:Putative Holliday junction resolvase [Candidatus Izimaplasma bacterium HR1]